MTEPDHFAGGQITSNQRCKLCRFWHGTKQYAREVGTLGECRRHSPVIPPERVVVAGGYRVWPTTAETECCGDFKLTTAIDPRSLDDD